MFNAHTDETVSVMEGDYVTLDTNLTEIQNDDTILWLFGPKDSIISQITRKHDLTSFFVTDDERFRGRLQVDQKTGSLTIRKTRIKHYGKYKLTISRERTTTKICNVNVTGWYPTILHTVKAVLKYSSSELVLFPDMVGETDGVKSVLVMEGDSVILQFDFSRSDRVEVWR